MTTCITKNNIVDDQLQKVGTNKLLPWCQLSTAMLVMHNVGMIICVTWLYVNRTVVAFNSSCAT
jgi:hypothetical protein